MIIKLLKKLINRIFSALRKRRRELTPMKVSEEKRCLFTKEQLFVIDKAASYGCDVSKIAKPKYTANQMKILTYADMLNIDSSEFNSFSMPAQEMEYHLYLATIDKYLGKNYLKNLLNHGKFSIGDSVIKKVIDEALKSELSAYSEIAASEIVSIGSQSMSKAFAVIQQLCVDRGIDPNRIQRTTVEDMLDQYDVLVAENLKKKVIKDIEELNSNYSINVNDLEGLTYEELIPPIRLYDKKKGEPTTNYYICYLGTNIYLCSKNLIAFKIK